MEKNKIFFAWELWVSLKIKILRMITTTKSKVSLKSEKSTTAVYDPHKT